MFTIRENRTASIFSTDSQMIPKWRAIILWQRSRISLNKRFFFEEGRRIRNDLWFMSIIGQST
jgi:hypothetical protein